MLCFRSLGWGVGILALLVVFGAFVGAGAFAFVVVLVMALGKRI